ncbi:unnamed protein product [Didymodactylos carnosus]|uniref:Uncharacterized protein n=1 Tax=Didymodactylos carnosus TaxID=1234261 RepID=A0A813YF73_9BILA|nr:unnamed protein product [Didymodactylos carnosus]CAF0883290.1 unnamed protein product [Didymodactylos carnosus]CAF3564556.1 unnamed protein product [Didymodactylos carnosus]CAF3669044.1 unnamed protein product [Didymodactylos carnosus]
MSVSPTLCRSVNHKLNNCCALTDHQTQVQTRALPYSNLRTNEHSTYCHSTQTAPQILYSTHPIQVLTKTTNGLPSSTTDEEQFLLQNNFRFSLIFSVIWLSYCWILTEHYKFDFGKFTVIIRLLFCLLHVLTIWKLFQYIMKLIHRFYRLVRRIRVLLPQQISLIIFSLILFLLLTMVLHFKQFLRDIFAIVD